MSREREEEAAEVPRKPEVVDLAAELREKVAAIKARREAIARREAEAHSPWDLT